MKDGAFELSHESILSRLNEPSAPDDRIYIVAGNNQQAHWHARNAGLSSKQWVYVGSDRSLRGKRPGFRYWLVGTWKDRCDMLQILNGMDYLGAVKWSPKELLEA